RTLKDSVAGVGWNLKPYSIKGKEASSSASEKAELVERALFGMTGRVEYGEEDFEGTIRNLMDSVPAGVSVSEVFWENRDGEIMPRASKKLTPRFYGYSMDPLQLDRLML